MKSGDLQLYELRVGDMCRVSVARAATLVVAACAPLTTLAEVRSTSPDGETIDLVQPGWNFSFPSHGASCVDGGGPAGNSRWVYYALPSGTPPAGGWPVWVELVTDNFAAPNTSATCGAGGGHGGWGGGKPFGAFATPQDTMSTCFAPPPPAPLEGAFCSFEMRRVCQAEEKEGDAKCLACATTHASQLKRACTQPEINDICSGKTPPSPPPGPPHHRSNCDYDQEAGAMWNQRLKQFLIANGVAVVVVNPHTEDSWDAGPWWWNPETSVDRPFLTELFTQMKAGKIGGALDIGNTIIRGWSGGAQMVSWLSQVFATNGTLVDGMVMKGGVMLSGGSYLCYNDAQAQGNPPGAGPVGSCQGCTEGGPSHCDSSVDPLCSSCVAGTKTYCGQCCPKNYTEPYFVDNPAKYSTHIPMFLAQTSKVDNHADLCACKNYYDTLARNGVAKSKLVLMDPKDENCFCIGNPGQPAAIGSPYSSKCDANWGTSCTTMGGKDCCIGHTLGFAAMIEPAMQWALDVLK